MPAPAGPRTIKKAMSYMAFFISVQAKMPPQEASTAFTSAKELATSAVSMLVPSCLLI